MKQVHEKTQYYIDYSMHLVCSEEVMLWIKTTLNNYLNKNQEDQTEIEHVIDYLSQNEVKKISQMSYPQAVVKAKKWIETLNKKAAKVEELPEDTRVIHDFKDGFKIVQLIGKSAYEREGHLMRHCVASYYGRDVKIYSLRDAQNNPHCTMEEGQQVKGKGNGDIHPKYVGYVVKFLQKIGMSVGDSEMKHLGYINVSKIKKYLHPDTKYFNKKYLPSNAKLLDKEGNDFACLDLLDIKPLIKDSDESIELGFDLKTFVSMAVNFSLKYAKKKKTRATSGYSSKVATSGHYSQVATSGDYSQVATSGNSSQVATSGDYSKVATSGDYSQVATSGDSSKVATSGDYSQVATSGDSSKVATSGYSSKVATSGYSSQVVIAGEYGVGAAIGVKNIIKATLGSWITLAEYDSDYKPICVKSAQIDGKKLKAETWYKLQNKKFVEVKE